MPASPLRGRPARPSGDQVARPAEREIRGLSGGRPLPGAERAFFEPRLGEDLGEVRVHTGPDAQALAAGVGARAFTHGHDVVFGRGEYAPATSEGRRLLAHELVHTRQQAGNDLLQRKTLAEELDEELAAWAKDKGKSLDPDDKDYAFTVQEYANTLIWDMDRAAPIKKPEKSAEIAEWTKKFKKAELLAGKILAAGEVDQKESRAMHILNAMARAGFSAEAVAGAARITDASLAEHVYGYVLADAKSASADTLKKVSEFFAKEKSISDNPLAGKLTDTKGAFEKSLSQDQLKAVLEPIIDRYAAEPALRKLLAEVLLHVKSFREPFSDWMWKEDKGELLFEVLETSYFVEPGYEGREKIAEVGDLDLETDLSWVYANKQKYYVGYLVEIGKDAGVAIAKPANLKFATLRKWLDDNTEKIGQALAKKYPNDEARWIEVYEQLTDIFFFHVDRGDVKPDLAGKVAGLGAAAPSKMRLKADCDVLATYAMRFFFAVRDSSAKGHVGFEPVGYFAVLPTDPTRVGHVVGLMRRDGNYFVISNKRVFGTGVSEAAADAEKNAALVAAKTRAMDVYYDPKPDPIQVFYADAGAGGAMPRALADTDASVRRTDLE